MNHSRHYTLEEANGALPLVRRIVEELRSAREGLSDEEARDALSEAAPGNGGGEPGRSVSQAFLALREAITALHAMEVVLRDLDRALLDFPSIRGGREVYLCWQEGEDEIGWWHEMEAGFAGRRPL